MTSGPWRGLSVAAAYAARRSCELLHVCVRGEGAHLINLRWIGRGTIEPRAFIPGRSSAGGFSLLEMMVAIAILALALGYLYQASGGATRNLRVQEKYAHGVELARSLLAEYSPVSAGGIDTTGSHGEDFTWRVTSAPVESGGAGAQPPLLHSLEVSVTWSDGLRRRRVALQSVVGVEK